MASLPIYNQKLFIRVVHRFYSASTDLDFPLFGAL
jgi:hypothetical protein